MAQNNGEDGPYDPVENTSPIETRAPALQSTGPPPSSAGADTKAVDDVLYSDIGIETLLKRLKQSVASARDFAIFLKKRAALEDDHARGMKKVSATTLESFREEKGRQGSYSLHLADVTRAHDRIADNGLQFSSQLNNMHDELNDLANNMERGRKHWKTEGGNNEQRMVNAETAMRKAKARYDGLAEDYDRARTGDKGSGRVFTVKGPKSAEKHEADLNNKLQMADREYQEKVQMALQARQENTTTHRPKAVKAIQELIRECDSVLTLQLQKFAMFNEQLIVSNGLVVSPLRGENESSSGKLSMRETISQIDNDRDFTVFIGGHHSHITRPQDIKYEKHHTLGPTQSMPTQTMPTQAMPTQAMPTQPPSEQPGQRLSQPGASNTQPPLSQINTSTPTTKTSPTSATPIQQSAVQTTPSSTFRGPATSQQAQPQPHPYGSMMPGPGPTAGGYTSPTQAGPSPYANISPTSAGGQQYMPRQTPTGPPPMSAGSSGPRPGSGGGPSSSHGQPTALGQGLAAGAVNGNLPPPTKPVFGITLDNLFQRDEIPVPMVVYQCIQAVDLFGLDIEGIYRLSGNANHIQQLKAKFDNDSSRIDFRHPEAFFHDVNSVAGLLKTFFRDLPEPLFTHECYPQFIEAARVDNDDLRRDSLHAVINALPDPNYATLRALVLHLNRVREHAERNRMTTQNLAICWAPTLMVGAEGGGPAGTAAAVGNMREAGLQARVMDTILMNTFQIFDEDQ